MAGLGLYAMASVITAQLVLLGALAAVAVVAAVLVGRGRAAGVPLGAACLLAIPAVQSAIQVWAFHVHEPVDATPRLPLGPWAHQGFAAPYASVAGTALVGVLLLAGCWASTWRRADAAQALPRGRMRLAAVIAATSPLIVAFALHPNLVGNPILPVVGRALVYAVALGLFLVAARRADGAVTALAAAAALSFVGAVEGMCLSYIWCLDVLFPSWGREDDAAAMLERLATVGANLARQTDLSVGIVLVAAVPLAYALRAPIAGDEVERWADRPYQAVDGQRPGTPRAVITRRRTWS
jgi:hypothetical protein